MVAERLRRAESEYRAAQREHDGSLRAAERYRQARRVLLEAEAVGLAVLEQDNGPSAYTPEPSIRAAEEAALTSRRPR